MKKEFRCLIVGIIIGMLLLTSSMVMAQGITKTIEVVFNSVSLKVNGQNVQTDNILYNGTTYVPLRAAAEMLGKEVGWDAKTRTASINDPGFNNNSDLNVDYPFNLSDSEIKNAIEMGKKGFNFIRNYEDENYTLSPNESAYNIFIDNVQIMTPYHYILRLSAIATTQYKSYPFEEAKEFLDTYVVGEGIIFEGLYFGSRIDSHQNVKAVIKQGDKIIHPYIVTGHDKFASATENWPNFPAYRASLGFHFSNVFGDEKIDYSKPAQLIIIHAPEMESIYDIDFSNYK